MNRRRIAIALGVIAFIMIVQSPHHAANMARHIGNGIVTVASRFGDFFGDLAS